MFIRTLLRIYKTITRFSDSPLPSKTSLIIHQEICFQRNIFNKVFILHSTGPVYGKNCYSAGRFLLLNNSYFLSLSSSFSSRICKEKIFNYLPSRHREPSYPFRIWTKDQTSFIARVCVLWRPFWIFNTHAGSGTEITEIARSLLEALRILRGFASPRLLKCRFQTSH